MLKLFKKYRVLLQLFLLLALIYSLHFYNYLLFHSFAELLGIVIAFAIFIVAWNSRNYFDNKIIFFLAMMMLPLAIIDSLHTFSFKGVSIFNYSSANIPTQLWLISRYFLSISILIAPFVAYKVKKKENMLYGIVAILASGLVIFFAFRLFPNAYIEGQGLTPFKIFSEYLIILIMGAGLYGLHKERSRFDREVYAYIRLAIISAMVAEFMFTLYTSVTDEFNLLGHLFTVITFFLFYIGIVEINLMQPYRLMFKNLNDLNTAKNEFLSIASHQLKNPLSVVLLSADMMKMDNTLSAGSPEYHNYLNDITDSVLHMKKIIETLLNVAKIELGVASIKEDVIELKAFIHENITELGRLAKEKNLTITNGIGDKILPDIRSDRQLLGIVFENILSNAIKYSKHGQGIDIEVVEIPELAIRIKDSGYGIPEIHQARIFKENFRSDNISNVSKDGTGLGLYMVKKIADKINLRITFESKENIGTVFDIRFRDSHLVK